MSVHEGHGDDTILVMDDDEGVRQSFARMLKLEGYRVRTATNAERGLWEVAQHHPDAIILDFRMPLIDGLGFLRRLRSTPRHGTTPVAIVTGDYFLEEAVSTELRMLGATLTFKPLWLEDLVDLARTLVRDSRGHPHAPLQDRDNQRSELTPIDSRMPTEEDTMAGRAALTSVNAIDDE